MSRKTQKLTDEQLEDLKNFLNPPQVVYFLFLLWTTKLAHFYIERTYHVSFSLSQVRNILHSMGMKPRPRHKKANKKAREEFSKAIVEYLHKRKEKHRVLCALSKDHFFYQFTEENFNSDVFEKFLLSLLEQCGKVVIVIDQATCHTLYQM